MAARLLPYAEQVPVVRGECTGQVPDKCRTGPGHVPVVSWIVHRAGASRAPGMHWTTRQQPVKSYLLRAKAQP